MLFLYHRKKQEQNSTIDVAFGIYHTAFYKYLNKQRIKVLMKFEPWIILKLLIDFEP